MLAFMETISKPVIDCKPSFAKIEILCNCLPITLKVNPTPELTFKYPGGAQDMEASTATQVSEKSLFSKKEIITYFTFLSLQQIGSLLFGTFNGIERN